MSSGKEADGPTEVLLLVQVIEKLVVKRKRIDVYGRMGVDELLECGLAAKQHDEQQEHHPGLSRKQLNDALVQGVHPKQTVVEIDGDRRSVREMLRIHRSFRRLLNCATGHESSPPKSDGAKLTDYPERKKLGAHNRYLTASYRLR